MIKSTWFAAALLGIGCCGCGGDNPAKDAPPERAAAILKGKIALEGSPVRIGRVIAVSEDGATRAVGAVQVSGDYLIEKVPLGNVHVYFSPPPERKSSIEIKVKEPSPSEDSAKLDRKFSRSKADRLKTIEGIAPRYLDPNESGWSITITEGDNQLDLYMEKE